MCQHARGLSAAPQQGQWAIVSASWAIEQEPPGLLLREGTELRRTNCSAFNGHISAGRSGKAAGVIHLTRTEDIWLVCSSTHGRLVTLRDVSLRDVASDNRSPSLDIRISVSHECWLRSGRSEIRTPSLES